MRNLSHPHYQCTAVFSSNILRFFYLFYQLGGIFEHYLYFISETFPFYSVQLVRFSKDILGAHLIHYSLKKLKATFLSGDEWFPFKA